VRHATASQRAAFDYALGIEKPLHNPREVARTKNVRFVRLKGCNYSTREAYVAHKLGRLDKGRTRCGIVVRGQRGVEWVEDPHPGIVCLRCIACEARRPQTGLRRGGTS
jgi:hypothetical protein